MLRTMFLCDYFTNLEFRRELHTLLNRGEPVHQLQRAIYYGRLAPERGRRRDELTAISGSHALLTNIVIAWNTAHMQAMIERWRRKGMVVEDAWLRRLGPVHFEHINFRGTFSFPVQEYAQALIRQGCAGPHAARKYVVSDQVGGCWSQNRTATKCTKNCHPIESALVVTY